MAYFALFHRIRLMYDVVVKQLLGLPRFQNLLLIVITILVPSAQLFSY